MKQSARLASRAGVAAGLVAMAGGCFYVDTINERPSASIEYVDPEQPLYQGRSAELTAQNSADPDGDPLTYHWRVRRCRDIEPDICEAEDYRSLTTAETPEFSFPIELADPFRVFLVVEDTLGATEEETFVVLPENHPPAVMLTDQGTRDQETGGYTLGRTVELFALGTDGMDEDALTYEFTLYPAPGSQPDDVHWEQIEETRYELRADVAGQWRVQVTVTDPAGATASDEVILLIQDDEPPAILSTDPPALADAVYVVDRSGGPRRFAVLSVEDDLDPYPLAVFDDQELGQATFRWWIASPATGGGWLEVSGNSGADYTIDPALSAPGDSVQIRVDALDRVARELPCAPDQPTCSLGGDGRLQRVTWSLEIR